MVNVFVDIGIIIIAASILGYIAKLFRQPLIPAYILSGFLIGPFALGFVTDIETIKTLSEIGIAFMLFVVGLEVEFKRIKSIGTYAAIGGIIQMALLFGLAMLIVTGTTPFRGLELVYIGIFVLFSSTMVGVKMLSDRKELDTLYGRMIVGLLLVEDIVAVLAIALLGSVSTFSAMLVIGVLIKALALVAAAVVCAKFIFPRLFRFGAKSQELLFLMSVAVCFVFAIAAFSMQFSIIIGAFIAGVALGNLPYRFEIEARVKSVRDFFATLFFVSIGTILQISQLAHVLMPLLLLIFLIIIIKPLITTFLASVFGYSRRTSFITGIRMAQTSEFSLIIATQGFALGHIGGNLFTMAIMLAVTTIIISTYYTKYNSTIYQALEKFLKVFDRFHNGKDHEEYLPKNHKYEAVLIGYDRTGYSILTRILKLKKKILVVDYNPEVVRSLIKRKIPCLYGDIGDLDILDRINFKQVDTVISTVPDEKNNALLTLKVKHENPKAVIFVTAASVSDALDLYDDGADYVVIPHMLGGYHVSELYEKLEGDIKKVLENKQAHIEELKNHSDMWKKKPYRHLKSFLRKGYKERKLRKNGNGNHKR